ncbi:MAG: holo-ACP synthase [Alphaproteobacteria bacterium]|nr:holo-ACP synthase [Alphaproteobacteria bacterium]
MIIGMGSDLVDIDRIQKILHSFPKRFLLRVFTTEEQEAARSKHNQAAFFAKRFAAKEACLKALGLGLRDGIRWTDMTVRNDALGKPTLDLAGSALDHLMKFGTTRIHLTLSDTQHLAQAFVVIESVATTSS